MDAIRGMRNSFESWDRTDSQGYYDVSKETEVFVLGDADKKLMMKLTKAGKDHAKFIRQILVSVDIIAPEYWWKEFDTYKVGTTANSTSMMHKLGDKEPDWDMFCFDTKDEDTIEYMNLFRRVREKWVKAGKIKHSRCPHWRKMNQLCAIAFLYRRTVTLNYAVLQSTYHSRKKHRLSEWQEFCEWVESLPYSELITLKEG